MPDKSPSMTDSTFSSYLQYIYEKYLSFKKGHITEVPAHLSEAAPEDFAISAVSVNGDIHSAGDYLKEITKQSISKPFVYGMVMEQWGKEHVSRIIGVEPAGDAFNSLIRHEEVMEGRFNPMVNVGAVTTISMVKGDTLEERIELLREMFSGYLGHQARFDEEALYSRKKLDNINRAIFYLLKNFGMINEDIKQTMDLYLQQCSTMINCRDLAMMGAALANDGVNPVSGERVLKKECIQNLLTVMYTCGMYDFAGEWAYNIGIPAKSGVSGCVLGVVPGQMGVAVFSPPLDQRGNSVRGIKVFEELSKSLDLHIFHPEF